jgi:RimJ/RimL family protein N-acetyltransferase
MDTFARGGEAMFKDGSTELVPVRDEHVELFLKWFNDPEVTQYLTMYLPVGEVAEREYVKRIQSGTDNRNVMFVISVNEKDGLVPIGTIGLHGINWKDRDAEVGIAIGEKGFQGEGHGSKALRLIIRYAFGTLNLHRLHARAYAFNERSLKLQRKVGFVEEGRLREAVYKNGAYHDVVSNGLLRSEWKEE